ncbi:xanthine dehydrogenase small subunit [Rhizobium sp. C4]|uniref:xanthine dehydrogenase small subunit n=1 Tax=Rhizobium sp. C4 TaxID=1349800 RepID=UPI001E4E4AF0|nr:xanthine dehydrogenase small subunit [Rhizobium sp. C4]MCD2174196.1 xanthine dehydrogenase small subunit [Rhizobium sp. C4]
MQQIRFVLNDETVVIDSISPTTTLLDWLRETKRLTGTKEGCGEGDCGACTVLVGKVVDGRIAYRSVNACIRFVPSLSATHVVTIEHLAGPNGILTPIQQALADLHGSQCGFCTPGIVMSLYALLMENPTPSRAEIEVALQGNLCRCTGYESIFRAVEAAAADMSKASPDRLTLARENIIATLNDLKPKRTIRIFHGQQRSIIPFNTADLADAYATEPNAVIVAGATDVGLWVTKQMRQLSPVIFINHLTELQTITETDDKVHLGAVVTYTQAQDVLAKSFPALGKLLIRIGGQQVRNMGTIGGNVANGSPIGDTPPALIALNATLHLRSRNGTRSLPLEDYFVEYGKQAKEPGEFVEALDIPKLGKDEFYAIYKISKRRDEDISALCAAFKLKLDAAGNVASIRIAFGGMAGTPKRASLTEAFLTGKPWNEATVTAARAELAKDYAPLSDWRASSEYRMLTAQNLLTRLLIETSGEQASLERYAMLEAGE